MQDKTHVKTSELCEVLHCTVLYVLCHIPVLACEMRNTTWPIRMMWMEGELQCCRKRFFAFYPSLESPDGYEAPAWQAGRKKARRPQRPGGLLRTTFYRQRCLFA
jgi:hypothetical protein